MEAVIAAVGRHVYASDTREILYVVKGNFRKTWVIQTLDVTDSIDDDVGNVEFNAKASV